MNTRPLVHRYQHLTPRERLPLLLAAATRGDAVEESWLKVSAPKHTFDIPDYVPQARALNELAVYHVLTLLDLGLHFWHWWGLWLTRGLRYQATEGPQRGGRGQAEAAKALETRNGCLVRYYAARFVAHVDGWKQFCAELHVEPEAPLHFLIGWDNIVRTESRARELAFTPEEALWFVRMETVPEEGAEAQQRAPLRWKRRPKWPKPGRKSGPS